MSFLTVKGAALFLPRGNSPTPCSSPRLSQRWNKHTGDLQKHLQTMFTLLRPEDTIRLAVRLESAFPQITRYMVVVSTNGRQDTEESIVLGMDFVSSDSCCSVGLVLPLWSDTLIHLDGDGGFSVSTVNRVHVFKPVSVQAMWSALQSLHKACDVARCHNYYPGSLFLTWVSYYQSRVSSSQTCINEWNAMKDVESHRAHSPVLFTDFPTERERTESLIKMRLREIMMQKDLENVTCKEIRTELEMQMVCNLREFKEFIDNEMIVILGQMDSPTEIFDHVFLGSEWNASNLEELQNSGVRYILNVTREIDNFFPGMFEYHNIRVYDEEATNLLEYWNETYKFITKAKKAGAKCLVHCKMGISRSASTVIAYAMKEYGWDLDTAFDYVKDKRSVTKPNPSFMKQLEEYQGILLASKQRHNKLWRSHSESDLSDRSDPSCKAPSQTLLRSDSHNNNSINSTPSFDHFLGVAVLRALALDPENNSLPSSPDSSDGGELPSHTSPLTLGSTDTDIQDLSDLPSEKVTPLSPIVPLLPPAQSDDNNNPSQLHIDDPTDGRGEADGSSTHSADSIDFFSAREKFLGLAQDDGRPQRQTEQGPLAALPSSPSTEESKDASTTEDDKPGSGDSQVYAQFLASTESQTETSQDTDSQTVGASSHTSVPSQRHHNTISQDIAPREVTVDGATVKESDTDQVGILGCSPNCEAQSRLARGSQELARIQQTLKELQAFLYDGVDLENQLPDKMDTEFCKDTHGYSSLDIAARSVNAEAKRALEFPGWHRAIELEARLRQAGLTPPSLMKRSASLAKLDCLELSANDLNDLDLTLLHSKSYKSQLHTDDLWKKQKVFAHLSNLEKLPLSVNQTAPDNTTSCCQKEDVVDRAELAQKQGRGHSTSSRRSRKVSADKKHRAVTVLYNTM
uniref:protein-serine/threonine phosphatase n=1 Tax=Neogobius melanostomus TaxID=47308 RepID=A0A8C6TLN3_9GOBI